MTSLDQLREGWETLEPTLWEYGPGASLDRGRLVLFPSLVDPVEVEDYLPRLNTGEVWSVGAYDARGAGLMLDVQVAAGSSVTTFLGLFTGSPRSNALLFVAAQDPGNAVSTQLRAVQVVAGVETVVLAVAQDAQAQRFLRIRESAGTVYWETSPDGFGWVQLAAAPAPPAIDLAAVRVVLGTHYWSPGAQPRAAEFDGLNLYPWEGDVPTTTGTPGDPFLAVDIQPDTITGTFLVDASWVDGRDLLAWSNDEPGTWVNIVCDVMALRYQRGATRLQGVLAQTEAGTGSLTISDTRRAFDPLVNADVVHKSTPLRVRAWGYDVTGTRWDAVLFTGEVDELAVQYQKADHPVVTVTMLDLVGPLTAWESVGEAEPGVGAGDDLRERVERVLSVVGRGELSNDSDEAYSATLAPTILAKPWQELTAATEAELGRLWVDRHNRLVTRARGSLLTGPVRGTLSDVHGEAVLGPHCCVADAAVVYGVEAMANRTIAGRRGGTAVVRRDDEWSQARHGVGTVDRRGLELQTDDQLAPWAESLITTHTYPELRVDSVTPLPSPADLDSALAAWPAVLQTDLGDRWLFRYHPQGPVVDRAVGVLGIAAEVTPEGWAITWTTAEAPAPNRENPTGWFVVDVSELDMDDVLAPYGSPVPL